MYASIDIGSNTILLLVAEWREGQLTEQKEQIRVPRLGQGMDENGQLTKQAIYRASDILAEFKQMVRYEFGKQIPIIVTATSAVREAENKNELVEEVKKRTGLEVKVISGAQEARLTYAGALTTLRMKQPESGYVVVDVGGGSTEIIQGHGKKVNQLRSYPMGSVRFSEKYIHTGYAINQSVANCREAIFQLLRDPSFDIQREHILIGVEGTATSLAYISGDWSNPYHSSLVNGIVLTADEIREFVRWLERTEPQKLLDLYPEVMKGRADVFLGGVLILEAVMHQFSMENLIISAGGIRHGAMMEYLRG